MKSALLVALATLTVASRAAATETVIDDFESGTVASWSFVNGAEFPGAAGALSVGPGHGSPSGASLAYDFTGGGHYVAAMRTLSPALTAKGIAFWVKAPAGIHATLRVEDQSGQVLQYNVARPLDAFDGSAWFRQVVALDSPSSHFGGANDGVVHQPIQALLLMAADPLEAGAKGVVAFDDIVALDSIAVRIDPSAATLVPAPPGSAELASRLGVNIHFTSDDRALDLARDAGFTRVRMDLGWAGVERTKGNYDFTALDGLVTALEARGMGLLLILDYFDTALYPGADSPDFGTVTVPAFAAMAHAAAAHFATKNVLFEIWNEPNGDTFWPPHADATSYAALANAGIQAVHQGNPQATVSTAGISGFDYAFFRTYLGANGGQGADAVGVHPYRQGGGESVSDDLLLLRSIVAASVPGAPPVWDTEWGYSSTWYGGGHDAAPRQTQATYAARELLSAWALGFPLAIYYDLRDDGTDPANAEHNFGLLQNDYGDKPAMVAVRTLTQAAAGHTFAGFIPVMPSSLHAMRLDADASFVVPLWSDAPDSQTTVTVPSGTTGTDAFGAPLTLGKSGSDLTVEVSEAKGPVYLTFPRQPVTADAGAGQDASAFGAGGTSSTGNAGTVSSTGGAMATGGAPSRAPDAGASSGADASTNNSHSAAKDASSCGCSLAGSNTHRAPRIAALLGLLLLSLRRKKRH